MVVQLIVIQVVTFIVLFVILRLLFYNQLQFAMHRLQGLHEENLSKQEKLKQEIEEAKKQRAVEIQQGKEEAKRIIDLARTEADKIRSTMLTEAEQRTRIIAEEKTEELEILKKAFIANFEKNVVSFAVDIIKIIFTQEGREALQHGFIDELLSELSNVEASELKTINKKIKLVSVFPLAAEQKEKIKKMLAAKAGFSIEIEEDLDKDLIAGMVLNAGSLVIDGSLKNRIKKIIPQLRQEFEKELSK